MPGIFLNTFEADVPRPRSRSASSLAEPTSYLFVPKHVGNSGFCSVGTRTHFLPQPLARQTSTPQHVAAEFTRKAPGFPSVNVPQFVYPVLWKGFWRVAGSGYYRECYHGCGRAPSEQICTFLLGECLGEKLLEHRRCVLGFSSRAGPLITAMS